MEYLPAGVESDNFQLVLGSAQEHSNQTRAKTWVVRNGWVYHFVCYEPDRHDGVTVLATVDPE